MCQECKTVRAQPKQISGWLRTCPQRWHYSCASLTVKGKGWMAAKEIRAFDILQKYDATLRLCSKKYGVKNNAGSTCCVVRSSFKIKSSGFAFEVLTKGFRSLSRGPLATGRTRLLPENPWRQAFAKSNSPTVNQVHCGRQFYICRVLSI